MPDTFERDPNLETKMKTSKLLFLFCLSFSLCASAQFGSLKDLAKKATKPKQDTNVQRSNPGTRDVNATADVQSIVGGETKEVTLTLGGDYAKDFANAEPEEGCLKVSDFKVVSDTQIKMKVTADARASDGKCRLSMRNDRGEVIAAEIKVMHKKQVGEGFQPEDVSLEKAFSSTYKLKFPDGKVLTLTRGKQTPDGGYEYKDSNGKWYHAQYMYMQLMMGGTYGNECSFQGMLNNSGQALFRGMSNACGVGIGSPIEASFN